MFDPGSCMFGADVGGGTDAGWLFGPDGNGRPPLLFEFGTPSEDGPGGGGGGPWPCGPL